MKFIFRFFVVLFALSLIVWGCEKNPVDDDHDHNDAHAEAVGLVITQSGTEIVRYESGVVTGQITVKAGEETPLLSVKFIDEHDGDLFTPEEDHYSFDWMIADESIAELEQYDENGKWRFHIHGKTAGNTTIEIKIMHDDHADFVSLPIPIEVTQ